MARGVWQEAGTADLNRRSRAWQANKAKRQALHGPTKTERCPNNPNDGSRHRCNLCCRTPAMPKTGRRYVNDGSDGYARLARAILGQAVRDLTNDETRPDAYTWLHTTELEVADWRETLCVLADVNLCGLRRVIATEGTEMLRKIAGVMLGNDFRT